MSRVILVGGAGFIGQSIVEQLKLRGQETCVLDSPRRLARLSPAVGQSEYRDLNWKDDSAIRRSLDKADVVIHLAWTSTPADSMNGIYNDAETNILRSIRLLEAAQAAEVPKFMFASSGGTVYGNSSSQSPRSETDATMPISAYGVSKLAVEKYVDLFARNNQTIGINLRMANPYGPGQYQGSAVGAIAHFMQAAVDGERLEVFGDGSIIRDYLYIEDVTSVICTLAAPGITESGTYNIGSGKGISIRNLIEKISQFTDYTLKVNYGEPRHLDVGHIVLDCQSLYALIGWTAETDLDTGLQIMWNQVKTLIDN